MLMNTNLREESPDTISGFERREFLKIGLVVTGVFAGGSILSLISNAEKVFAAAGGFEEKYPYKPHYSMVIRQNLCIDCEKCLTACRETNNVPSYGHRTAILEKEVPDAVGQKVEFIPVLCMQCNDPPCVRACPTKASYKDEVNGVIRLDDKKCIGCKVCMVACPYNARYFNNETHAIDKCNFCFDTLLSRGEELTACSAACPTGARTFGDISDSSSKVYKMVHQLQQRVWVLRAEAGTKPNIFYMKS